jgi:hypothetical protein
MRKNGIVRTSGTRARSVALATMLLALLASLALASTAAAKAPTGDFAVFSACPTSTPGLTECILSEATSGEVKIGNTAVPIKNKIVLQGGYVENEEAGTQAFVGASNGVTLSKSPQPVPGGLLALVRCNEISNFIERVACELTFENGVTGVTATTELAKPASAIGINTSNLINREGVAVSLPVKIKLENPFLGGECYIGSSSNPVTLNLTTGTTKPPAPNKPISGKSGIVEFKDEFAFTKITGNSLVDNAFSAPGASGCGGLFSFLIDPIVNSKLGLPSAAGKNTAILNGTVYEGFAPAVIASEK